MNVLIHCAHVNESDADKWALIPMEKLEKYDLDFLNGKSSQHEDFDINRPLDELFDRLGIKPIYPELDDDELEELYNQPLWTEHVPPEFSTNRDLEQYLDPKPPFTVDKYISIIFS